MKLNRSYLLSFSLLSFAFFIYQVSLFREMRFQIPTAVFGGPFLIGFAILLTGLGSLLSKRLYKDQTELPLKLLSWLPLGIFASYILFILVSSLLGPYYEPENFYRIMNTETLPPFKNPLLGFSLSLIAGPSLILLFQGVVLERFLGEAKSKGTFSSFYSVDMLGAGLGAILAGITNLYISPFQAMAISSLVTAISALVLYGNGFFKKWGKLQNQFILFLILFISTFFHSYEFNLTTPKFLKQSNIFSKWGAYQRVDVLDKKDFVEVYSDGLLFYPLYKNPKGTIVENGNGIPHALIKKKEDTIKDILMIGTGIGGDVYTARKKGFISQNITAVEIDKTYIEASKSVPWLWKEYSTANIINNEGRNFIETTKEKFDLVYFASADPKAGLSNAHLPDSGFLYTAESIKQAQKILKPNGTILIKIAYITENNRFFVERLKNTIIEAGFNPNQFEIFLTKKTFSIDFASIKALFAIIEPGKSRRGEIIDYNDALKKNYQKYYFDNNLRLGAVTDQSPINFTAISEGTLFFLSTFFILILIFLFLPKLLKVEIKSTSFLYFSVLGLSWMLVQIIFQFHSFILLGNPSLSVSLALGFYLLFNALGAYFSSRKDLIPYLPIYLSLFFLLYILAAPLIIYKTNYLPTPLRFFMYLLCMGPLSFFLGMIFPLSIEKINDVSVSAALFPDFIGIAAAPFIFWTLLGKGIVFQEYICMFLYLGLVGFLFLKDKVPFLNYGKISK